MNLPQGIRLFAGRNDSLPLRAWYVYIDEKDPDTYTNAKIWKVRDAIGAGPALIINGEIRVTSDEEVFFGTSIPKIHPRTAVGYSEKGALILMVVDGRQERSRGVSLDELAILMYELDVVEAINLDGGGSSTLVVNNRLVNRPTGGITEREVMSVIATFAKKRI
jgi:exopolysaccharide biosynthesis protein